MKSIALLDGGWLRPLVLAGLLLAPLAGQPAPAQAEDAPPAPKIRVVACDPSSLSPSVSALAMAPVAPLADSDTETDQVEEDQQPRITGSIPKPAGISEDDSKALAPLATVSRDDALKAAKAALADSDNRKFDNGAVEGENGWLVWAIPTTLRKGVSGANKELEVKVDAGGSGYVLSIECD